jgi:hypothetical protein
MLGNGSESVVPGSSGSITSGVEGNSSGTSEFSPPGDGSAAPRRGRRRGCWRPGQAQPKLDLKSLV